MIIVALIAFAIGTVFGILVGAILATSSGPGRRSDA